jgi:hypothetical protein
LDARLTTLLCKRVTVAKYKDVKTGSKLVTFYKESYCSKSAVLPMMMNSLYFVYNQSKLLNVIDKHKTTFLGVHTLQRDINITSYPMDTGSSFPGGKAAGA